MNAQAVTYYLQWKGNRSGPFTVEEIKAKLGSGEISRMHQVEENGKWYLLNEFLGKMEAKDKDQSRKREDALREKMEGRLEEARRRQVELQSRLDKIEQEQRRERESERDHAASSLSHLVPRQTPPPPPGFGHQGYNPHVSTYGTPPPPSNIGTGAASRTSGMAIAALVLSLCNFVPGVNFFAWILAIIFGHTALSQIKNDPSLGGRGMAVAALVITYLCLIAGVLVLLVMSANGTLKF